MKRKVLVVDDDPLVQRSCERILLGADYDVRTADTGSKGLSLLAEEPFDLALVDLKLPGVSGMEILREAPDKFPDVPHYHHRLFDHQERSRGRQDGRVRLCGEAVHSGRSRGRR